MPNVTSFGRLVGGVTTGLTAGTTQTAAGATALTGALNTVTVVAADNASSSSSAAPRKCSGCCHRGATKMMLV